VIVIIGLIPARGGSKGIPRKNLAFLGGKTLLEIGVAKLFLSGCDEVFVSTDDQEISECAREYGAKIINRPSEISEDTSSTESVILHAINSLRIDPANTLVIHQITSPMITVKSIVFCINSLENSKFNSAISVFQESPFIWVENEFQEWEPNNHDRASRPLRQDLAKSGIETGGIYVAKVKAIIEQLNRFPVPTICVPVSYIEAIDINTEADLNDVRNFFKINTEEK
jgi:N-acylneuraminate cytidylyltransferase